MGTSSSGDSSWELWNTTHSSSHRTSLVAQTVKCLSTMQETRGSILGLGRSPGEGNSNPLQYYCLENPMDRGSMGSQRVGHDWVTSLSFPFPLHTLVSKMLVMVQQLGTLQRRSRGSGQRTGSRCNLGRGTTDTGKWAGDGLPEQLEQWGRGCRKLGHRLRDTLFVTEQVKAPASSIY